MDLVVSSLNVSVVMATYNRPKMLRRALCSVLAQTYEDFDLTVVDDGSETAMSVVADMSVDFQARGVEIKMANMEYNTGYMNAPLNAGVALSEGKYLAYLDDDNEWDADHLESLVREIEETGADLVYSRWRYRGDGPFTGTDYPYHQPNKAALGGLISNPRYGFIDTSSIIHQRESIIKELGPKPWDEELNRFGDWDFARRVILAGLTIHGLDKVTFTYNWHGKNLCLNRRPSRVPSNINQQAAPSWKGGDSVWRG